MKTGTLRISHTLVQEPIPKRTVLVASLCFIFLNRKKWKKNIQKIWNDFFDFMSQWNIAPILGNFYRVPHPLSLIVIMYPSFLRSSSCNCEEENIERKHFKLRHSITSIFELAILMALLITDPLRLVFKSLSYLLTPDSPNGFWKL